MAKKLKRPITCLSDKKTAEEFAVQYKLSPSFITMAVRTAQLANGGLAEVKQSLNALEKAYNNGRCIVPKRNASTKFNPKLLNTYRFNAFIETD